MKRTLKKALAAALALCLALALSACAGGDASADGVTLKVGASPSPHGDILKVVQPILAKEGITLEIVEFTDYVLPNTALEEGSLDANFFQHEPYLLSFNEKNGTHLVSVGGVHYEPMGLYPGKTAALADLADGAAVGIPNDETNEARALLLLQDLGYITLEEGAGLAATPKDIAENPRGLEFKELAAEQLPISLPDLDIAVINGNYAVTAGIQNTVLVSEPKDGDGAAAYQNILVVREGETDNEAVQKLFAALTSDAVRAYIEETYPDGSVLAVF